MKTEIFKTYSDFLNREDKKVNGVTKEFADVNEGWNEERDNEGCWNCCSGCSHCYGCSDCSRCSDCSGCSHCSDCFGCFDLKNAKPVQQSEGESAFPKIPKIENIHQKIYEAVQKPKALDMSDWHTCETTHCRAGWAVHLAGEDGKKLEEATSTVFAAMQIYKASSEIRVWPTKFYGTNQDAMKDIKRCAEEEQKATS